MAEYEKKVREKLTENECYYVQNGVSLGYCAQIAGMSKERFIRYLSEHNSQHNTPDRIGRNRSAVAPLLEKMAEDGFYVDETTKALVLKKADES